MRNRPDTELVVLGPRGVHRGGSALFDRYWITRRAVAMFAFVPLGFVLLRLSLRAAKVVGATGRGAAWLAR